MRVLIVDDHALFRDGIRSLLTARGFEVVGEAESGSEAVAKAGPLRPDVILMDVKMPSMGGLAATKAIKTADPAVKIVMLTVSEDDADLFEAIKAGADGYLLKRSSALELLHQLESIVAGGAPLTAGVARTILDVVRTAPPVPQGQRGEAPSLTDREKDVLQGLVNGRSYKQVGDELGVSLDTVRSHIRSIYRKLQVHSVAEAVSRALRERLV